DVWKHTRAGIRKRNGSPGPIEQLGTEQLLERAYLLADGPRRHMQLLGRIAEAQLPRDGFERSQRAKGRQRLAHLFILEKLNNIVKRYRYCWFRQWASFVGNDAREGDYLCLH